MKPSEDEILQWVKASLKELFQVDPGKVDAGTNLFTDLGLDSIDEVELALRMQEYTGRRLRPEEFKVLNTVQDVMDSLHQMMAGA